MTKSKSKVDKIWRQFPWELFWTFLTYMVHHTSLGTCFIKVKSCVVGTDNDSKVQIPAKAMRPLTNAFEKSMNLSGWNL